MHRPAPFPAILIQSLILFIAGLLLFSYHNDFSYKYHPDEGSKVLQVLNGKRNLRHPPMLLNASVAGVYWFNPPPTEQSVVVTGRWVSAAFGAAAVCALALTARLIAGAAAGWLTGALTLTNPQLFELSHYMKEDTALLLGWSLTWLAIVIYGTRRSKSAAVWLGVAAAMAASGKYLGALALGFALAAVVIQKYPLGWRGILRDAGIVTVSALLAFALINLELLWQFSQFSRSMDYEMGHILNGQSNISRPVPHSWYLGEIPKVLTWPLIVGALLGCGACWSPSRRRWAWLAVFPPLYLVILSCSPKVAGRYLLPLTVTACLLAALAVPWIASAVANFLQRKTTRFSAHPRAVEYGLYAVLALLLLGSQRKPFRQALAEMRSDGRQQLVSWLQQNVPPSSVIVYETQVGLTWNPGLENHRLLRKDFAPDAGTIEELIQQGVSHVVVFEINRSRYTATDRFPQPAVREQFDKRRRFYEELKRDYAMVWVRYGGRIYDLMPFMRVYDLRQPNPKTPPLRPNQ